ncbi:MAG: peptide chain release factor N(5)-glutamine methyltransferase [Bacilli bacterium]
MNDFQKELTYLEKYLKETGNNQEIDYDKVLCELKSGKPIQYIIGNVNFYGNTIDVNESVLIPRFETELLVEKTITKIKKYFPNQKVSIIDLGTGSGCIAISLKKNLDATVDALDISKDALEVAKTNAQKNNAVINFINDDMTTYQRKKYDIIISNPPYIRFDEPIMDIVKNNEPSIALYAKEDGLYYYRKILENIKNITNDKFLISFEIGLNQSTAIVDIAKKILDNVSITVEKDYSDKERFIFITNIK